MERFSPKIEIINHFDNLINRIDIDIDSSIEKFNDKQLLVEILKSTDDNRCCLRNISKYFKVEFFDKTNTFKQNIESWTESTKVTDYLKQVRMRTIEELKNAQEETLEYYKLNSERFKSEITNEKNIEELKSELFAEKFYFQVNFKQSKNILCPFNVFTFVTDFYMSQSYIDSLEKLINSEIGRDCIFDDKMVLTGLLYKYFTDNLLNFPNHVIHVRKEDVLNIKSIDCFYSRVNLTSSSIIDLSKLEELSILYLRDSIENYIEGLSSLKRLHLRTNATNPGEFHFSIKNVPSLINFSLYSLFAIDQNFVTKLLSQIPHIQELLLDGYLSNFNLDNLVNLRELSIGGRIEENFNFELFKNLCKQLEDIKIKFFNIDEKTLFKLFDGYNFPYLRDLTIEYFDMKRLKKEFINRLPMPRQLNISYCNIEVIEHDSFSNMEQLTSLDLSANEIEFIEKNAFSNLKNLQKLDLSNNKLTNFDRKFIGLIESVEVKLENNRLRN